MPQKPKFFTKDKLRDLGYIVYRNVFLLTNGIIFAVIILLFVFGDAKTGTFIGIILVLNVSLGLAQDIRAWLALDKLQLLTTPHVIRLNSDGTEESVAAEQINKGDHIKLKIGDQVPADGDLLEANGFELNEGLITGESDSLPKATGSHILAGSVVTAGSGVIITTTVFRESRIARMTEGVRKYSVNKSPIQESVAASVRYFIYVLIAVLAYLFIRAWLIQEPAVRLVTSIGTMTSMLVPQGLIFAITLFFAYGAVHLFNRQVLLQEVNATEKLGRIKYLCMDKTGTITQNELTVEQFKLAPGIAPDQAEEMIAAYIKGTQDSSAIIVAVKKFLPVDYNGKVLETLMFSSWRQYGAVRFASLAGESIVFVGLPDVFLPHLPADERDWLQTIINENSHQGKRVLCVAQAHDQAALKNFASSKLSAVAVFIFHNDLRPGIRDAVDFFQNRGVKIKIISGDNPETTRAIAAAADINDSNKIISGAEIAKWNDTDYQDKIKSYALFAGIVPEQKEKIVGAFRSHGYTAMIGDGANDALAIKQANLGIAMFDGAPATRQLASVVLMNNSFAALPGGVELADNIIRNIEIFASMFFNQTFLALFFFLLVSVLGYEYPFTPLNITLINYFIVGIPGILLSWWTLYPSSKVTQTHKRPFLKRVLPFSIWSAVWQAVGVAIIFLLSPMYLIAASSNTLVLFSFIIFGFTFFACAPAVFREKMTGKQKIQVVLLAVFEIFLMLFILHTPFLTTFFNVTPLHLTINEAAVAAAVAALFCFVQYLIARRFIPQTKNTT